MWLRTKALSILRMNMLIREATSCQREAASLVI